MEIVLVGLAVWLFDLQFLIQKNTKKGAKKLWMINTYVNEEVLWHIIGGSEKNEIPQMFIQPINFGFAQELLRNLKDERRGGRWWSKL